MVPGAPSPDLSPVEEWKEWRESRVFHDHIFQFMLREGFPRLQGGEAGVVVHGETKLNCSNIIVHAI